MPAVLTDWQQRAALGRVMELIGEAVKRLLPDSCQRYPAVPWKLIVDMRDHVSHGYDCIDYATLWADMAD